MTNFDDQTKIHAYLRREVFAEESFVRATELDPYTRLVYRRIRELYWTTSRFLQNVKEAIAPSPKQEQLLSFAAAAAPRLNGPRIFIDATDLVTAQQATGIQRVVREISRNAVETGLGLPVAIAQGRLVPACRLPGAPETIDYREGDILLLLDSGWNRLDDYPHVLSAFRAKGGKIVGCVYDLFPLIYPPLYTRGLIADFRIWTDEVLMECDAVVAISHSVAESFAHYAKSSLRRPRAGMRLGWWRLGADLVVERNDSPTKKVVALAERAPYFLSVGTLEMRKGYPIALAAFERLWAEGLDVNYVIIGRPGWNAAAFEDRLRHHPERGRRLFWLSNADDRDLRYLYKSARGVILATFAEGFGLPLVEAAQFNAPVIASDIEVFHEVGGAGVNFFQLLDAESLVACIRSVLAGEGTPARTAPHSWRDSSDALLTMLRTDAYQTRVE